VRSVVYDSLTSADPDELITTGEAAALLNSSRQHVVDLCNRGDLPFTTVGKHRRIRRGDVDALRTRTNRLTRDQERSLWLAYATAGEIVRDPERALEIARRNLQTMQPTARGQARRWLEEWAHLLEGPLHRLLDALTSPSPKGRELRQNAPFAGVLSDHARGDVLDAWRRGKTRA
jgi:excisionase family DNA binding protein